MDENRWAHMDLTDGVVVCKLNTCYPHKTQDKKVGKISWRNEYLFPVEKEQYEEECERGKGQSNEDQFSRGKPNVEKGFGDHT